MRPRVSIILPNFNYGHYLSQAIESVLRQTRSDWELIIVDDGSSDGSLPVIEHYCRLHPDRIRLHFHDGRRNLGLVETYRAGIAKASGEYTAFLEADDIWHPENLAQKAGILDAHPEVVVAHSKVIIFGHPWLAAMKH